MRRAKYVFALVVAVAMAMWLSPATALADGGASDPDDDGIFVMGNDSVWFGRILDLSKRTIDNDLVAAGQTISLSDCTASGSIRAAAQVILIDDSSASQNITVAAQSISIRNADANVIAAAAETIEISGTCEELTALGKTVFIDCTVNTNAVINAETVEIGPNAHIEGTLSVTASTEPVMRRGAEVNDVEYRKSNIDSEQVKEASNAVGSLFSVMLTAVGIVCTPVVAVLAEWLFRRHADAAATMARSRTGILVGTGIIGAMATPVAMLILLLLVVTAPVALALVLALLAMATVAGGFAGASLFRLAFPKLGRYKRALAGGAIVGVAGAIPVLGLLVRAVAFVFLLGYVLQSIYLGLRS